MKRNNSRYSVKSYEGFSLVEIIITIASYGKASYELKQRLNLILAVDNEKVINLSLRMKILIIQ